MKIRKSVGYRLLFLVAGEATIAILLVLTSLYFLSAAVTDYRHMYSFQMKSIVGIGVAIQEAADLKQGERSAHLDSFYRRYRNEWETASAATPDAIRFRQELSDAGETLLPQVEMKVISDLGNALRSGNIQTVRERLAALQDVNTRYAEFEYRYATQRLQRAGVWLVAISVISILVTCVLGVHVFLAVAPRIHNMVFRVRRFQESGIHERIADTGKDDIAVLANAIDLGFSAIASRERDRKQFMAIAAHELKTPVTTIQGYASLLAGLPGQTSEVSRALEIINRQSWRLSRLIEALFLAVEVRNGSLHFEPKPLDLSVLVQRVLREMDPFLSKNAFASRITANISILGDEALLEHALWCLFTCAALLSPKNGPVQVCLARKESAMLSVDVQTTEVPIPDVQELFLPFQSLQYETGGGLRSPVGLYLCREIVRVHNGSLYVHPVSELQPEFLMELPI